MKKDKKGGVSAPKYAMDFVDFCLKFSAQKDLQEKPERLQTILNHHAAGAAWALQHQGLTKSDVTKDELNAIHNILCFLTCITLDEVKKTVPEGGKDKLT